MKKIIKINFITILISGFCFCVSAMAQIATLKTVNQAAKNWPQNAILFVKNQNLSTLNQDNLKDHDQKIPGKIILIKSSLKRDYLHHFLSPWFEPYLYQSSSDSLAEEKEVASLYKKYPGWLENKQKNTQVAVNRLINNMGLKTYPNLKVHAILTHNASLRQLPTSRPIFGNWHQAGEGFPFDNLQVSYLKANSPVYILHVSHDGAWDLITTSENDIGWVKNEDLAYVSNGFVSNWSGNSQYVVAVRDGESLFDSNMNYYAKSRIGELFPLVSTSTNYFWVKLAARDNVGQAHVKVVRISKKASSIFPLPVSHLLLAKTINQMLNTPYGWGELYGYRDCSATLKDLFSIFGIWLPRNSGDQAHTGRFFSLENLSSQEKLEAVEKNGLPFLTLLYIPGHIMLYLGKYHQQLWVFHSPWGLHTQNLFSGKEGRAIIGRSIITPLTLGKDYKNVAQSLIDRTTGMTLLSPQTVRDIH